MADRIEQLLPTAVQLSGPSSTRTANSGSSEPAAQSTSAGGGLPRRAGSPTRRTGHRGSLSETLSSTLDRYRSLAGACCRAVRLDLLLLAAHHMGAMAAVSHVPQDADEARQVHPSVSALTRAAGRAAEELTPYLSPRKAAYTLGCVAPAGACLRRDSDAESDLGLSVCFETDDCLSPPPPTALTRILPSSPSPGLFTAQWPAT